MVKNADAETRRVTMKVNLPADVLGRLDRIAKASGASRSALVRRAVERVLEDAEDIAVSEARLADPGDPLVAWNRAKAELGG